MMTYRELRGVKIEDASAMDLFEAVVEKLETDGAKMPEDFSDTTAIDLVNAIVAYTKQRGRAKTQREFGNKAKLFYNAHAEEIMKLTATGEKVGIVKK